MAWFLLHLRGKPNTMPTINHPIRSQQRTKAVIAGSLFYLVVMSLVALIGLDIVDAQGAGKVASSRRMSQAQVETPVRGHSIGEASALRAIVRALEADIRPINTPVLARGGGAAPVATMSLASSPIRRTAESIGTRGHIQTSPDSIAVVDLVPAASHGIEPLPTVGRFFGSVDQARPPEEQRDLMSYLNYDSTSVAMIPAAEGLLCKGLVSRLPICQPSTILRV